MTGSQAWRFASVLLFFATLTGCASSRSWSYTPEPRSAVEQLANVSVIVLPFEDRRPKENSNFIFIYLIPLVPFGWMDYETPEGPQMHVNSGLWQFRPADDFARAVAQEIDNARIFRETFVGNRASEADYVLLGEITSTKYEGKIITYGLSVYGPLLWFFGFPAGYTSNGLTLTLKLAKAPAFPRHLHSHSQWAGFCRELDLRAATGFHLRPVTQGRAARCPHIPCRDRPDAEVTWPSACRWRSWWNEEEAPGKSPKEGGGRNV